MLVNKMKRMKFGLQWGVVLWMLLASWASAATNCATQWVYVQVPADWTTLYYEAGGTFFQVPNTAIVNGWYKFHLDQGQGDEFIFGKDASWYPNSWISKNVTSQGVALNGYNAKDNDRGLKFSCADFGTYTELYLSEDLTAPGRTFQSNLPPNAKYFYFLPPDDEEWMQGTAQMVVNGGAPVNMEADPTRCGWYRVIYFNIDPPTSVIFQLDINPVDYMVGARGVDEDVATPADLKSKFETIVDPTGGNSLFFAAEEGDAGWVIADPLIARDCTYPLKAELYDTDPLLHPNFILPCGDRWTGGLVATRCTATFPSGTPGNLQHNDALCLPGVRKGIVQATLGSDRLPIYNNRCFDSQAAFDQLFRSTPGVNEEHCMDLTFTKSDAGMWEYDSYNATNPDGSVVGGYYPLENVPASVASTKTMAECRVNILPAFATIDPVTGLPAIDSRPVLEGDFGDGDNPLVWDWDNAKRICALSSSTPIVTDKGLRNQHFCFASHADFIYRPGQKFSFRGDDDIWVFINNELVVDNGGVHLAAPGYVDLDQKGLTAGGKYNIDIFFCDRKPTMSNIRIKTNMYFQQKKSLFYDVNPTTGAYDIKKLQTGGSGCTGGGTNIIPGSQLNLLYTLISSKGDTVDGDPGTPARDLHVPEGSLVWGGITVSAGIVTIDTARLSLPPGRYRLVIQDSQDPSAKLSITIRIAGNTAFYSVNGSTDPNVLSKIPAVDTLAGRLVQFRMAKTANGEVDTEGEASFQVMISSPDLLVFRDAAGTQPYNSMDVITKADGDSAVSLWATSRRPMAVDTATYSLTLIGSKSSPIYLKFHMPRIAFVQDSTSAYPAGVLPASKPDINGSALNWSFVNYPTYLVIYDPATGEICLDCNEIVTPTSSDSLAFSSLSLDGGNTFQFVNGRLVVLVRGTGLVVNGSFVVQGAIDSVRADWTPISLEPPPTPRVKRSAMFDRNSDGIADSLFIEFNKPITDKPTDVPDFIVVRWPSVRPDTQFVVGRGVPTPAYTNDPTNLRLQQLFPSGRPNEVSQLLSADGRSLAIDYSYDSVNTSGIGTLEAWFTFVSDGETMQIPVTSDIADSMPPIIRLAEIKVSEDGRGFDTLYIQLTEPLDTTGIGSDVPFEFRLLSSTNNAPQHVSPSRPLTWNTSGSMATLQYDASAAILRPREGDSVRISIASAYQAKDMPGNVRSLRNPFVRINGDKRPEIQTIYYAEFDESAKKDGATIHRIDRPSIFHGKVGMYDSPELIKQTILNNYGPILGHVIRVDLAKAYAENAITYKGASGNELMPTDVVLHYEVFYHTNLGAYVAGQKGVISCADSIYNGDCRVGQGPTTFPVVAWNVTSKDNRMVGSGPYLSYIKTWLTIPQISKSQLKEASKSKRQNFGAMRKKKGNLIKLVEPKE